ncbi:hypothetical protein TNCV_408171 [Trichonephila clavipes]|nr:hypothetical protein TNCV_408171 [Trichonephila clavipes]
MAEIGAVMIWGAISFVRWTFLVAIRDTLIAGIAGGASTRSILCNVTLHRSLGRGFSPFQQDEVRLHTASFSATCLCVSSVFLLRRDHIRNEWISLKGLEIDRHDENFKNLE